MTAYTIRTTLALLCLCMTCHDVAIAGPKLVPHPSSGGIVKVSSKDNSVIHKFKDAKDIALLQGIFFRAKKIGDTRSHLKKTTHKLSFSDSWLLDMNTGETGVLSKAHKPVYKIEPQDLKKLKGLLKNKAEQVEASDS